MVNEYDTDELEASNRPNKSQIKRDIKVIADLAKKIVLMPESTWVEFSMPQDVLDALAAYKNIRQHGAQKRQMKFIVKSMQAVDMDIIQKVVDENEGKTHQANAAFHAVERWRDRLIEEDQETLSEFLSQHEVIDIQHFRQVVQMAKREAVGKKKGKHARQLFKIVKNILN